MKSKVFNDSFATVPADVEALAKKLDCPIRWDRACRWFVEFPQGAAREIVLEQGHDDERPIWAYLMTFTPCGSKALNPKTLAMGGGVTVVAALVEMSVVHERMVAGRRIVDLAREGRIRSLLDQAEEGR